MNHHTTTLNISKMRILHFFCWLLSGALLGLSGLAWSDPLTPVLWLVGIAFWYLLLEWRRHQPVWMGLAQGLALNAAVIYWLVPVTRVFAGFSLFTALLVSIFLYLYAALPFFSTAILFNFFRTTLLGQWGLAFSLSWTISVLFLPTLIPWPIIAPLIDLPILACSANIVGVHGLGFLVLWWIEVALFQMFRSLGFPVKQDRLPISGKAQLVALFIFISTLGYGAAHILPQSSAEAPQNNIQLGIVQANLDPHRDFRPEKTQENITIHRQLSKNLLDQHPDLSLLLWPESSVGWSYGENQKSLTRGHDEDPFPGLNIPLVFGGQVRRKNNLQAEYYTTVNVLMPEGDFSERYRKQVLFPISERPFLFSDLIFPRSFSLVAGKTEKPLTIPLPNRPGKLVRRVQIGAVICYEDLFPDVFRSLENAGPVDLFVVFSNDNWFLESRASLQHAWVSRWRAIEFGKDLLRVTNNGQSVLIRPDGQLALDLPTHSRQTASVSVSLRPERTIYSKIGDSPLLTICFLLGIIAFFRPRNLVNS